MGKFQLNKKGEDPLKIYEDTFKIANDTVETHLDKLGKMPNPISSESQSQCPACKGVGCGVCDQSGFVSREDYDKMKKIFESKANEGAIECPNCGSSDVDDGEDYGYDKDGEFPHLAGKLYQCNNCEKKFNGESKANEDDDEYEYGFIPKVSGFGEDKDKNLPIKDHTHNFTSGYQLSNGIDYILQCSDSGCGATKNKDLYMESKASEWNSVEAIASEYTSHKYDKEIQQTLDNIAKKQAEYTRECPDGCGMKFNTIDDNAVAYHLYNYHGYSSEDSMKSAGLEAIASEEDLTGANTTKEEKEKGIWVNSNPFDLTSELVFVKDE